MQIKLLEEVIVNIAGETAREVLKLIEGKKDVSEFLIAKKLGLTVNQVRNIFYKLLNYGLVYSTRKKDKRKKWYTYYWTLNTKKSLEFLKKRLEKEKEELEKKLNGRLEKRFYYCKTCEVEVGEEKALLNNFTCPECGNVYELSDNSKAINEIKTQIAKKERQIKSIENELRVIEEKEKRKKEREKKKQEKEKKKTTKKKTTKKKAKKKAKKKGMIKNLKRRKVKNIKKQGKRKGKKNSGIVKKTLRSKRKTSRSKRVGKKLVGEKIKKIMKSKKK